ncbi:interferon-induced very large GTPase 1-like [Mytilus trossulus]|uniref:interferon-induced very large GTPase 1-like n=1 Tax=Mytilus trossulus TaxID=6551 RepID=UPI0030066A12
MDDRVFVGLVIAILAVLIYYQWTFVACLLTIVGTGVAVRRQIAVTDNQKFRKDLQTNIRGSDKCSSARNIQTLEMSRMHANDDENCNVDRNEGENDEKEPKKDLQTNILIIGADKSIDNIKTPETDRLDANVDYCTVDTKEEHSDKKRYYQIGETFSETTLRDDTNVAAIYSDTANKAGTSFHEEDREDREEFVSEVKSHEDDKKPEATSIKEKEMDVRVLGSVYGRSTENTTTAQCISHETNERIKIKSTENIEKALDMQKGQSANDKSGTKIAEQVIDETNIINSTEILNITCASVENSLIESTSSDNRLQCTLEEYGLDNCHWSRILKDHLGVTTVQQLEYLDGEDTQKLKEHVRHNWEKKALDKLFIQDESNVKYKSDATKGSTEETVSKRTSENHFGQKKSKIDNDNSENVSVHISQEQTLAVVNKLGLRGFFPNGLTLQSIIRIQKLSNHDRFDDIPWVFMRNIMMINWTARDILIERHLERLWESQQMSTEDWNFESTNKDTDVPKNTPQTINPLDLIVALWQCCSPILLQVLSTKMFMCRLSIPFSLPPREDSLPVLSVWGIRQIIIEQKTIGGTLQTSAYKCPCHVVSFIRLGKICISKSKLINQLLSEQYHDTFFNRDCPLGTTKRLISDGLLEAAWHLPRENSENVMLYLNLRGDGLLHDTQIHVISQISSVVVILMDISLLSQTSSTEILHKMYESTTGVVLGIDACNRSDLEARAICLKHLTDNSNYRNKIKVCKLAVDDTISSFSLIKKEMMKGVTDIASCDPMISFSKRLNKTKKDCYHIDEDSKMFQQAIKKAAEITQLLQDDSSNLKDRHVPLQGNLWRQFSEIQKAKKQSTLHQPITDEENKKEEMMRHRKEQLKILKQQRNLMKRFQSNLLDNKSDEDCILFITYLRLFLDDVSRNSLPAYLNQYQMAWQELKTERDNKEKKMEVLQERLKQAEYNLANASFGYEHLVRECGQIYECIIECDEKDLITKAKDLSKICAKIILLGQPFEIMDGDAANVPIKWIRAVFTQLRKITRNKKILALSVLGIQSSGKSTLLNTMFGLQFAVSAGRCTRGVYVQLVPVNSEQFKFDYILVVDTEGLRASELGNQKRDHDNKLATFVIGLGDITIINIKGENTAEITDILQIAVHAFLRLKLVNQKLNLKQKCIFVHQNVPATDASDKMLHGRKKLVESLDEMTIEAAKQEQITNVQTFDQVIDFDSEKNVWYFSDLWVGDPPMAPTNPGYSKSVADVKHAILYELTPKRDTFFTIKDTLIRMEDLWTGILRDDFVYGFRNSLEMKAYSTMEKRYQEVHWNLHKFFYEFVINKAKTVIESSSEEDDLETRSVQIRKELKQEAESIVNILLAELDSFVNTSDLKDACLSGPRQGHCV